MSDVAEPVAAVRRFNRFYTRRIGVLDRSHMGAPFTLAEGRVLYELAQAEGATPTAIAALLGLDPGYLTRIIQRFEREGLVRRERSGTDKRSFVLRLTPEGRAEFDALQARSNGMVEGMIGRLPPSAQAQLTRAMGEIETLLSEPSVKAPVMLRPHRRGDMGWVVERHAELYGREYGWKEGIEAVTARVVADFLEKRDPARERCWIAERDGERLGSVFLVDDGDGVGRLRLLMVEPAARGEGLGRRLVDECVGFAREAGYREVVLWTHGVLTAARRIYAEVGFQLERTWTHDDFGMELVSETWRLRL